MKIHLLLLMLVGITCLPTAHTQLLTPIPDTTNYAQANERDKAHYIAIGFTARAASGYRQMRDFYNRQGFDDLYLEEVVTLGAGFRFGDRYHLEVSLDRSFTNDIEDVQIASNGHILSLRESKVAINFLLGYRVWQKRHQSLILHAGLSWLQNRGEILERRPQEFDFDTANINVPQGVRSWPAFIHQQGALHLAVQLKLSYPRPRWWSTDTELKFGFISGLNSKSWSVDPGQAQNLPSDRAQYFYISGLYHFFLY